MAVLTIGAIVGLFFAGLGCGWHGRGAYERDRRGGFLR
jgi:hypothetical protein